MVQYLLSKKANIHQKDKDGWSALHNACSRGNLPIVRLLVERNARVNAQNKTGHTPLSKLPYSCPFMVQCLLLTLDISQRRIQGTHVYC